MLRFNQYSRFLDDVPEPRDEGYFSVGVARGYPRGDWTQRCVGTDCNGQDAEVMLLLHSGHFIGDHSVIYDRDVTDVRGFFCSHDYAAEEIATLVISACERDGSRVSDDARDRIMAAIARSVGQRKVGA